MRFPIFLLILATAFSCCISKSTEKAICCKSRLTKKDLSQYSILKLGKEYRHLKEEKLKCCDDFGSDFHKIMLALSVKFDSISVDTSAVIKVMGYPDSREVPVQYGKFNNPQEKIFVYWWRYWHDFLYFIIENNKVKYVKWFYAYE